MMGGQYVSLVCIHNVNMWQKEMWINNQMTEQFIKIRRANEQTHVILRWCTLCCSVLKYSWICLSVIILLATSIPHDPQSFAPLFEKYLSFLIVSLFWRLRFRYNNDCIFSSTSPQSILHHIPSHYWWLIIYVECVRQSSFNAIHSVVFVFSL